ncbi:MAG: hypothetical protein DIU67_004020 [Actinomycetes bacterium]|jgi:hypothetical protein|nr:MAG: hypothetical protein DIU67_00825 [Actinomycetota bacterium]
MSPHAVEPSTRPHDEAGLDGTDRWLRIASLSVIVVLVGAGLLGLLGLRVGTVTAAGGGLELEVRHASVTRPGIATPFVVKVSSSDGSPLPALVTIRIDRSYLEILDENGIDPDPTTSFQDERWTWWGFAVPEGAQGVLVGFDARLQPSSQVGRRGTVAVEVDGQEVVSAEILTVVMP